MSLVQRVALMKISGKTKGELKNELQEKENKLRLAKLRLQAEKMKQELGSHLTGGSTIESAIEELNQITKQKQEIEEKLELELQKQTREISEFYDKKIARLSYTEPWDREFETEEDYKKRITLSNQRIVPFIQEKERYHNSCYF